jgi:hypothetical protein
MDESFKGVIDSLDGYRVRVILDGAREPLILILQAGKFWDSGASYPGALFEITIAEDLSYSVVHSVQEEAEARRAAPQPNLDFLDT